MRKIVVLVLVLAVTGCQTLAANVPIARLAAPLKTGLLAGEVGADLDDKARTLAANTEYRALETGNAGASVGWRASASVFGSVTPQQPYAVGATNCRRYTHTVSVDGKVTTATATACRSDNGVWAPLT